MTNRLQVCGQVLVFVAVLLLAVPKARADLLGYWSADSTNGEGTLLANDQGNGDLDGELVGGAEYSGDSGGHTGQAGDFAVEFPGADEDYAVMPPTDVTFAEITITTWVNGFQNGDWAGMVVSRDAVQPLYLGFSAGTGTPAYVWNNDAADTWGWPNDLLIPEDEWTFVALTVTEDAATMYVGPLGEDLESDSNEIPHFEQDNFWEWRLAEDDGFGGARNFAGLMDDVSIWDQALSAEDLGRLHDGSATPLTLFGEGLLGDYNNNDQLDAGDLDLQAVAITEGENPKEFDLDGDDLVNYNDRLVWVDDLKKTWIGDANLDFEFNSGDMVQAFVRGKYETGAVAGWEDGDWNGDTLFGSSDMVAAFVSGGYEKGQKLAGAVNVVPEPSSVFLIVIALLAIYLKGMKTRTIV